MKNKNLSSKTKDKIERVDKLKSPKPELVASVIIVTYKIDKSEFRKTLRALDSQGRDDFEVVIVDNGNSWDVKKLASSIDSVSRYLKLKENYGLNIARNIGTKFASGEILIFLDDDGVPAKDFIKGHLKIYQKGGVVAARGKVLPKNENSILNKITGHYDLGDKPFPYYINTEGNSSIKRELFLELEGVKESLSGAGGHEGAELSYRIAKKTGKKDGVYYNPWAVIYHDYSPDLKTYFKKQIRHKKHGRKLEEENPKLAEFVESYQEKNDSKNLSINLTTIDQIKLLFIKITKKLILYFV